MCMEKLVELLMEDFVAKLSWCSRREGISVAENCIRIAAYLSFIKSMRCSRYRCNAFLAVRCSRIIRDITITIKAAVDVAMMDGRTSGIIEITVAGSKRVFYGE